MFLQRRRIKTVINNCFIRSYTQFPQRVLHNILNPVQIQTNHFHLSESFRRYRIMRADTLVYLFLIYFCSGLFDRKSDASVASSVG